MFRMIDNGVLKFMNEIPQLIYHNAIRLYDLCASLYNIYTSYWFIILIFFIIYTWICFELDNRWGYSYKKFRG